MRILKYLLLLSFINLCNSFSLTIKNRAIFISRHNLNMGCDYYIDKSLCVYDYHDITISYILLETRNKGYIYYNKDEDEDDYDYEAYKQKILESTMEPIIIYSNNTFTKLSFENKYKELIEFELKSRNKTWDDVNKVAKEELRYS